MRSFRLNHLFPLFLLFEVIAPLAAKDDYTIENGNIFGYGNIGVNDVDPDYGGGFSMYSAVWPLVEQYPGNTYQTGLLHTWMFAQYDPSIDTSGMYSCIEGGLGWWRDTVFATETPKFIMGGVALKFTEWANGPGAGQDRNWDRPAGNYAIAQLNSRVLWPPDGLNFKQGTCGQLFGYGYRPLPLVEAQSSTYGQPVPTGNQCWTLFINSQNAKGPIAFFLPEFFSRPTIYETKMAGQFLDTRPSIANRPASMETQNIPVAIARNENGECYAKVAQVLFPGSKNGKAPALLHNVTAYKNSVLWDTLEHWFQGGAVAPSEFSNKDLILHSFSGQSDSSWGIESPSIPAEKRCMLEWDLLTKSTLLDEHTFAYKWNKRIVPTYTYRDQPAFRFPQYFKLVDKKWTPVPEAKVPEKSGLLKYSFEHLERNPPVAYVTPEAADSPWKKPGPVSGPHLARLGDGSVVTYHWYRFADQPAIQKSALTSLEREFLQERVEKIHRHWTLERTYIPEPGKNKPLAQIDPGLVVSPPPGLEIGYVPIVTRQELSK